MTEKEKNIGKEKRKLKNNGIILKFMSIKRENTMNEKEIKELDDLLKLCDTSKNSYLLGLKNVTALLDNIVELSISKPEEKKTTDLILKKISEIVIIMRDNQQKLI